MGAALSIRQDLAVFELRRLARQEKRARVAARLLAIANALDGMSRLEAARAAGMDRQTLRDWVIRFNAAGPAGLADQPRSGRPPQLSEAEQAVLKALVLRGPDRERDGVSRWRIKDICVLCADRFAVVYQEAGMLRLMHSLNLSWQKTRPHHPQADAKAQRAFKKGGSPGR